MINEIIKPLLLDAKVNHLSDDQVSLKLECGKGVYIMSLIILILIPVLIYFFFEHYEITCQSKSKNNATACVLQVKHFIFPDKKTVHLGQLEEARTKINKITYKNGNLTTEYNIILKSDNGNIPLFTNPRTVAIPQYIYDPAISQRINEYIKESNDTSLKIDDPNGWMIYFLYGAFILLSILTLYNILFLDSISFLLDKNRQQLIVKTQNSFRSKETRYALPDIDKLILRKKGENIVFGLIRNFTKSKEEKPVDISKLKYKTFKMKRMLLKSKASGEEYNFNKGFLFAIYLVLKTGHSIQLTAFHYVNRKELLKATEELNEFIISK